MSPRPMHGPGGRLYPSKLKPVAGKRTGSPDSSIVFLLLNSSFGAPSIADEYT